MSCPQRKMGALSSDPACSSSVFITPGHFPPSIFFLIRQHLQHSPVCGYSLKSVPSFAVASQSHDSSYSPHVHCRGCFPLCLGSLACPTEMVDDKAERYAEYSSPLVSSSHWLFSKTILFLEQTHLRVKNIH